MESPGAYPESPLDQDDVVYPCKGCGEILEEGKAFELAGNRWHIDCFRCNTCGTLLDSDANLLLLGDGSLICNNCTYSCNHCGNKIEDLAILTGDQAFCANCFRCRNCKRKIENLRYARTSQGIFCMSCHESLMARRRKKSKKPPAQVAPKVDKSLPALPPQADQPHPTFTPDLDTPSDVFSEPTTTDVSPRPPHSRRGDSSSNFRRDASPVGDLLRRDNTTLPATTYNKDANNVESSDAGDDSILLPFALDPNPAPGPSPLGRPVSRFNDRTIGATQVAASEARTGRDYFNRPSADHRDMLKENSSRSASKERRPPQSPHIAFQEKGRQPSETLADTLRKRKDVASESPSVEQRSRSQHASPAPSSASEPFKLQEVPKNKKAEARRKDPESRTPPPTQVPQSGSPTIDMSARLSRPLIEPTFTASPPAGAQESPETSGSSFSSNPRVERPTRGDSLNPASLKPSTTVARSERTDASPTTPTASHPERTSSSKTAATQLNTGLGITSPVEISASKSLSDIPVPPARSAGRLPPPSASTDTFTSPRAPPPPPPPPAHQLHKNSESTSSVHSEASRDQYPPGGLPRYSHQGDFSMDEDFARLLGSQEGRDEKDSGVFRRVSNAVSKHGRSFSDRGSVNSRGHKKWPTNGSIDISSPTVASPDTKEESINLRNELRRAQQRITELEAEKNGLQESMHSAADIRQANTVLREKRNTMAVLDTQREMVIRELEIMTEHLKRAKEDSNGSMDINQLKSDILKDFANSLHKLKDQLGSQIEDLIAKRSELTDEISNLIQMKDKGFQEYESLTAANSKMNAMNRELVDNIQKTLQSNKKGAQNLDISANGLGIYNTQQRGGRSDISVDAHGLHHDHTFANLHEHDSEATLAQPQVVNIRKTGKPTKFSTWKKGSQAITKNVTKGFKGAFGSESKQEDYNIKVIGTPYGSIHSQPDIASLSSSLKSRELDQGQGTPRAWFGGKPGMPRQPQQDRFRPMQHNDSSANLLIDASTVLFGSDLTARCEFEKQMIPRVVSRCIEEVELRGMDVEGIYRKSGGTSQINQIRSGFEADSEHDVSDPDLDIHAVTSALKNYFRRLPVPLITFDVYDQFLEAGQIEQTDIKSKALLAAVNEIPKAHRDTLQFLVFHLSRVIHHASDNLMTPLNLAVVFAPTIMRPMDIQRELTDVLQQRVAVQALLENYKTVFGED